MGVGTCKRPGVHALMRRHLSWSLSSIWTSLSPGRGPHQGQFNTTNTQIQIHKYTYHKYKYTNTNTNTNTQIQIQIQKKSSRNTIQIQTKSGGKNCLLPAASHRYIVIDLCTFISCVFIIYYRFPFINIVLYIFCHIYD